MKVVWSEEAAQRLDKIVVEVVVSAGREKAKKLFSELAAHVALLGANPQMGRMVPEHARADVRELISRGYRIVYIVHVEAIEVVTVVRGRQPLPRLVLPPIDG